MGLTTGGTSAYMAVINNGGLVMWIVLFKAKDALASDQRVFGPFENYSDAEDCIVALPVASECDHKYIAMIDLPEYDDEGKVKLG